ncbi:MAG: hypothetical protein JKY97_00855 [Citromicrobium sp.]|nr:hypothetical protein [Citromicrobium sp.]
MRATANLFRSPRPHAGDQALCGVIRRQQMRPHLTRQHRVQPVGLPIGPSTPVGQLIRRHIQPPVRDRSAYTGDQASQVIRLGQQPPAFDQGRNPIGVGLAQALLTLALRLDTLALGLLLELAQMLAIGPFAFDDQAGGNLGDPGLKLSGAVVLLRRRSRHQLQHCGSRTFRVGSRRIVAVVGRCLPAWLTRVTGT